MQESRPAKVASAVPSPAVPVVSFVCCNPVVLNSNNKTATKMRMAATPARRYLFDFIIEKYR
jgi:hypothetical protein